MKLLKCFIVVVALILVTRIYGVRLTLFNDVIYNSILNVTLVIILLGVILFIALDGDYYD